MANFNVLSQEVLEHISEQIGEFLPLAISDASLLSQLEGARTELGDSLPIWILSDLNKPYLEKTGRWYHQIYVNDEAKLYAESQPLGPKPEDWQIQAVFSSELPYSISNGITYLQNKDLTHSEVRLLFIPSFLTYALWIHNNQNADMIYILETPNEYTGYKPKDFIDFNNFIQKLKQIKPIKGLLVEAY